MLLAAPASAQRYPDHTSLTVNDFGNVLSPDEEAQLSSDLRALRQSHGVEFTVVTMRSMRAYGYNGQIEPYATQLFNRWGVGNAERNDGIMLLVAVNDRQMRIELGRGYSVFWNSRVQHVVDDIVMPDFRREDYAEGIIDGTQAVIRLVEKFVPPPDVSWWARPGYWVKGFIASPIALIATLLAALGGPPLLAARWSRRLARRCPNDGSRMVLLGEGAEDLHLDAGKQAEERIGSVNHDVWQCQTCGTVTVEGYRRWFSHYGACRECGYRTVTGQERTVVYATEYSTGTSEVTYDCRNCGAHYVVSRTTPVLSRNDSDSYGNSGSSGGSSSFGGGSSSGGGASGRW